MLEIQPYRESDQGAVVALWRESGLVRPWNDSVKDIHRKLRVQPDLFLVGTLDSRLVATVMAGYEGHRGWINYLAVAKECRKQGIGRRLIGEAEARPRAAGCPKISLQIRSLERRSRRVLPLARVLDGRRGKHGQAPDTGLTRTAARFGVSLRQPTALSRQGQPMPGPDRGRTTSAGSASTRVSSRAPDRCAGRYRP